MQVVFFLVWWSALLHLSFEQVPDSAATWEELASSNGVKFSARNGKLPFSYFPLLTGVTLLIRYSRYCSY